MNTKKAVFNKLFGKKSLSKTELKNVKVDLGVVDELENMYNDLDNSFSEAEFYAYDRWDGLLDDWYDATNQIKLEIDEVAINGTARGLEEQAQNALELVNELELKSSELGIDPSELVANFEEIKVMALEGENLYSEFLRKYREVINITNNNDFL